MVASAKEGCCLFALTPAAARTEMFSICLPDLEAHVFAWHEFGFMFGV